MKSNRRFRFDCFDQLIGKILAFDIDGVGIGIVFGNFIGNSVKKMGLAQPGATVDEQWVISPRQDWWPPPGSRMGKIYWTGLR